MYMQAVCHCILATFSMHYSNVWLHCCHEQANPGYSTGVCNESCVEKLDWLSSTWDLHHTRHGALPPVLSYKSVDYILVILQHHVVLAPHPNVIPCFQPPLIYTFHRSCQWVYWAEY